MKNGQLNSLKDKIIIFGCSGYLLLFLLIIITAFLFSLYDFFTTVQKREIIDGSQTAKNKETRNIIKKELLSKGTITSYEEFKKYNPYYDQNNIDSKIQELFKKYSEGRRKEFKDIRAVKIILIQKYFDEKDKLDASRIKLPFIEYFTSWLDYAGIHVDYGQARTFWPSGLPKVMKIDAEIIINVTGTTRGEKHKIHSKTLKKRRINWEENIYDSAILEGDITVKIPDKDEIIYSFYKSIKIYNRWEEFHKGLFDSIQYNSPYQAPFKDAFHGKGSYTTESIKMIKDMVGIDPIIASLKDDDNVLVKKSLYALSILKD